MIGLESVMNLGLGQRRTRGLDLTTRDEDGGAEVDIIMSRPKCACVL